MKPLPSVTCARYQLAEDEIFPGYISVLDVLQGRQFPGRLLPDLPHIRAGINFWLNTGHPSFLALERVLDYQGKCLAGL